MPKKPPKKLTKKQLEELASKLYYILNIPLNYLYRKTKRRRREKKIRRNTS